MAEQKITEPITAGSSTGCGCGSHADTASSSTPAVATCCGTREAADAAGACCDPAAKKEAVAAGAS